MKRSMNLRGVFFDMDGVVIDSDSLWESILSEIKDRYSLDFSVLETCDGFNLSNEEAIRLVLDNSGRYSESLYQEILACIDTLYILKAQDMAVLHDGIPDVLERLRSAGLSLVLVSNSNRIQMDTIMRFFSLYRYFGFSVSSVDVKNGKPDPEPYLKALSITGLSPEEAIVVEDSPTGVSSAQAAGLEYITVSRTPVSGSVRHCEIADYILE